jgi:hypothetical protein
MTAHGGEVKPPKRDRAILIRPIADLPVTIRQPESSGPICKACGGSGKNPTTDDRCLRCGGSGYEPQR